MKTQLEKGNPYITDLDMLSVVIHAYIEHFSSKLHNTVHIYGSVIIACIVISTIILYTKK